MNEAVKEEQRASENRSSYMILKDGSDAERTCK